MQTIGRWLLRLDAAARLGPRPVALLLWHRLVERPLAGWRLRGGNMPGGPFLAAAAAPPPAIDWLGGLAAGVPALRLDLFGAGDIRPVWERNRWAELPRLAAAGDSAGMEALLQSWTAANPAFRGPNWACGQEAALRVLHLGLALALLRQPPAESLRALVALHARRIAATPAYALAQDNNHPVSEACGLFACGLLLDDAALAARAARRLARVLARLVDDDGGFAPVSTGYQRLLLDVLAVTEQLRHHHGAPPLPAVVMQRAAAATAWLQRLAHPGTGSLPLLGHQDGSAFADLAGGGPQDARASLDRAAALFGGEPAPPARWQGGGVMGWRQGSGFALLRSGPLRFRPQQADLLHLELWHGALPLLRDGGTGSYNRGRRGPLLASAGSHNLIRFDGREPMPRAGRFLLARWPRCGLLADGAWTRDRYGNRHARRLRVEQGQWIVTDQLDGGFRHAVLRWRLAPGEWHLRPDGVAGPLACLRITADTGFRCRLRRGFESLHYGSASPLPVLEVWLPAPVTTVTTRISLPG